MYEIEVKISIPKSRVKYLLKSLPNMGFIYERKVLQGDIYIQHPVRDFGRTDEALRIREEGKNCFLTYKGKNIGFGIKKREEIEIPFSSEYIESLILLFKRLDFKIFATIYKKRIFFRKGDIVFSIDYIKDLGFFVEIEVQGNKEEKEKEASIFKLMEILNLSKEDIVSKTYLELYLERVS